jgi:hypothetical protein
MSYILSIYASFISSPIPLIISLIVHYVLQFLLSTLPHHILPSNPLLISNLFLFMSTFSVVTSFTYFYFITLRYHLFFLHVLTHSYCPSPILPPSSLLPFVPFSLLPFLPSSLLPFLPSSPYLCQFRSMESSALESQGKMNGTLALLQDRLTSANSSIYSKTGERHSRQ